jgi:hypothetical protein
MAATSLNLLRYFYGGGERAPRRASKEALCLLLRRVSSPSRRHCCSARGGTAAAKEQSCLRSSDLVAIEYADLNLPNKASEVTLCSFSFSFFLLPLPILIFYVFDKICSWDCRSWVMSEYGNMSTLSVPLSLYVIHWEVFSFTNKQYPITKM